MNFPVDSFANSLKEFGSQVFLNTLARIHGAKDLVFSQTILNQLDSICGMQKLRQNAVDKVFKLQSDLKRSETKNRVYVIRPIIKEIQVLASQINSYLNREDDSYGDLDIRFWIVFVPSMPHFCDLALEEEGIYEFVSILECPLTLIPLECDLYSLENERIFNSLYLQRDLTPLNEIVASIVQVQELCGKIPQIHGQGKYAKIVADRVARASMMQQSKSSQNRSASLRISDQESKVDDEIPSFTHLFLVDRDCDYASILLSQLNYEGLLDDTFGIFCNKFQFEDPANSTIVKHNLCNENDPIFREFRDKHFFTVFSLVKTKNREMKEKYKKSQAMDLSNLKNFVANELKGLQNELKCLALHISACEAILQVINKINYNDQLSIEQALIEGEDISSCHSYITKMIDHRLHPFIPLRLLSLLSLTQGGLSLKEYKRYRSSYCQILGLANNELFDNLEKLGFITWIDFSLTNFIGGKLGYNNSKTAKSNNTSSLSFSSITGAMSSFTEVASGKVANAVSNSVLPRKGNLSNIIKKFNLIPQEVGPDGYSIREPKDPAFVFNGAYIPLICQLIDLLILKTKNSFQNVKSIPELSKSLPGPNFKLIQNVLGDKESDRKCVLVYFIGGVTYAEVTALRYLAKKSGTNIAVATSSLVNGNRLIQSLIADDETRITLQQTVI